MNGKKTVEELYAELTKDEIVSGPLTFKFYEPIAMRKEGEVHVSHIEGCIWETTYTLRDNPEGISIHLAIVDPSRISIEIKSTDTNLIESIFQNTTVLACPIEVFYSLLKQRQISIRWLGIG